MYTADQIWGAAAAAWRINKGYTKSGIIFTTKIDFDKHIPNKLLAISLLDSSLSEEDIELGRIARTRCQELIFDQLIRQQSMYKIALMDAANRTQFEFNDRDIGLICSAMEFYDSDSGRLSLPDRLALPNTV